MNCFGVVCVVSNWLQLGSKAAGSFGWVITDGFGWLWMVSGGFGWFAVLVVTTYRMFITSGFISNIIWYQETKENIFY